MITKINIPPDTKTDLLAVLSLSDAKAQIKVDHTYEDDLIERYIQAAFIHAQQYTSRTFLTKTATVELSAWFTELELPVAPVNSLTQIQYKDENGATQTLDPSNYLVSIIQGIATVCFVGDTFPELEENQADAVTISVSVGQDAADIPEDLKIALLLLISQLYEYRGVTKSNFADTTAASFLRPYRIN